MIAGSYDKRFRPDQATYFMLVMHEHDSDLEFVRHLSMMEIIACKHLFIIVIIIVYIMVFLPWLKASINRYPPFRATRRAQSGYNLCGQLKRFKVYNISIVNRQVIDTGRVLLGE